MEVYTPTASDLRAYRNVMLQHGAGFDSDGYYVYSQEGEGLAQFFGSLFKTAVPLLSRGIKGAATILKPHLKKAAAELVTSGSKRLLHKISGDIVKRVEKPKKRRRRRL